MNKVKLLIPAVMALLILTGLLSQNARAQIDPQRIYFYENGIRVGEVYVPDRAPGQAEYLEHWVLYPNYLYPGPRFIGALQIVPSSEKPYASESEFFRTVPFAKGSSTFA